MTLTADYLATLKTLCEKATRGPWKLGYNDKSGQYLEDEERFALTDAEDECILHAKMCERGEDATFIAESRTAIPLLIQEIERLQDALKAELGKCRIP